MDNASIQELSILMDELDPQPAPSPAPSTPPAPSCSKPTPPSFGEALALAVSEGFDAKDPLYAEAIQQRWRQNLGLVPWSVEYEDAASLREIEDLGADLNLAAEEGFAAKRPDHKRLIQARFAELLGLPKATPMADTCDKYPSFRTEPVTDATPMLSAGQIAALAVGPERKVSFGKFGTWLNTEVRIANGNMPEPLQIHWRARLTGRGLFACWEYEQCPGLVAIAERYFQEVAHNA